jgi:hypothetical protein
VLHLETRGKIYGELRYNYETGQTLTLLGGRTFSGGKTLAYHFIPMIGFSKGVFTGISVGLNTGAEWGDFYFSSQAQQSWPTGGKVDPFFFTWSEAGYMITRYFMTGLTVQYSREDGKNDIEPGIVASYSFKKFSFPCYLFYSHEQHCHLVLGVNYEWRSGKRASN